MQKYIFLILCVLCATFAQAQEMLNIGRSPFAIQKSDFDCDDFIRAEKTLKEVHFTYLWSTFGKSNKCVDRVFALPTFKSVTVHLINEPCHRNKRCGSYEFLASYKTPKDYSNALEKQDPKLKSKFIAYATPVKTHLEATLPKTAECIVSGGLESNVSVKAATVLNSWTRELFPLCRILWNPLKSHGVRAEKVGADLVEEHGLFPTVKAPCTVNTDGTDIQFPSRKTYNSGNGEKEEKNFINAGRPLQQYVEKWSNMCEKTDLWVFEDNCIRSNRFEDPRKRSCAFVRSRKTNHLLAKEIRNINKKGKYEPIDFVWGDKENLSLKQCTSIKPSIDGFKKGFLLKQSEFADRGMTSIFPRTVGIRSVKMYKDGKVIATFTSKERYKDGRELYRSNTPPSSMPFQTVLKVKTTRGTVCYKIDNPRIRND